MYVAQTAWRPREASAATPANSASTPVEAAASAAHDNPISSAVTAPRRVDGSLVGHLYDHVLPAVISNVVLAAVVAAGLWQALSIWALSAWLALIAAVAALRITQLIHYRRAEHPNALRWRRYYVATLLLNGALWGATIPAFGPSLGLESELFLVVAVAGVSAGALPVNGAIPWIYCAYLACSLLPVVALYLVSGGHPQFLFGVMGLLYAAILIIAAVQLSRRLRATHELSARLEQANRELARQATHDPLTGLPNRTRFESAVDSELERVARYGARCALVMLDIDHFKRINDAYGHATGDEILERVGATLKTEMRGADCAARWGGEEFIALLPETGLENAHHVAERIRCRVVRIGVDDRNRISASLGVAVCNDREERSTLFQRLDRALYRAKQHGRNRVELAQSDTG